MDKKWLSQWYDWLRAERGYGDNTLSAYARDIEIFCEFLAGENLAAPALTTLARRVSIIRSFYRFVIKGSFSAWPISAG